MSFLVPGDSLWKRLSTVLRDEGFELYDAERLTLGALRMSITRTVPGEAVSSGDCSRICRRLMVVLAAEGNEFGFPAEPEIEVSSPGVNRALRLPEHFLGAVGERVKFVVRDAISIFEKSPDGQAANADKVPTGGNSLVGKLAEVSNDAATVVEEKSGAAYCIPLQEVRRAQVDFPF